MQTKPAATGGQVERGVRPLVERLREAAKVWGEDDGGALYAEAADALERDEKTIRAMVAWLEANQPDVFKRGMWDAINAAAA